MIGSLARTCWSGLLLAIAFACFTLLFGTLTTIPGPDSRQTLFETEGEAVSMSHGLARSDTLIAILYRSDVAIDNPEFIQARESLVDLLRRAFDHEAQPLFSSVRTSGHSWAREDLFNSPDQHHLLIIAESPRPVFESPALMQRLVPSLNAWKVEHPDYALEYTSSGVVSNELFTLINHDLDKSLAFTLPLTAIILLFTFGTIGASLLALLNNALSLIVSLGIAAVLSHLISPISATAAQLVVLIVMAIGTDYALFYIARARQEIGRGCALPDALERASVSTGTAILWSGITVAASLTGLLMVKDSILTSMAAVSIIAVLVTLAYTLKVLPALITIFAAWLEWGKVRAAPASENSSKNFWVLWSVSYPRSALFSGFVCLSVLTYFGSFMNLGSTMQPRLLPSSMQSSQALSTLERHFPDFSGTELTLVLYDEHLGEKEADDSLEVFFESLRGLDWLHGPTSIRWSQDRSTARYAFTVSGTSQDEHNRELFRKLNDQIVPGQLEKVGVRGYLTGKLAFDYQQEEFYRKKIVAVIISVLAVSLVFLMIAFESIVIPVKAFFLNLLSTGAAFGVVVLLFQLYGWEYGMVESFVPALLFSILFGLSMDYHLLLISRIQECVRGGMQTRPAVVQAISDTYGVISGAAIIMTSVFVVISLLELPLMKQLGIGLACAVILDATIVRCVMLPASVILLGEMNWYMPQRLKQFIQYYKQRW